MLMKDLSVLTSLYKSSGLGAKKLVGGCDGFFFNVKKQALTLVTWRGILFVALYCSFVVHNIFLPVLTNRT